MNGKPLTRSRSDRILFGVCGGIARWLGWDSTLFRVVYVLVSVCSAAFPGILVYVILAIVILIFGANRLPELGRGIGRGIRNFKDATREGAEKHE